MMGRRVVKLGKASPIWTIHDVAEFFGESVATIRRWYQPSYKPKQGGLDFSRLPRFYIGGMWRWSREDVFAFSTQGRATL